MILGYKRFFDSKKQQPTHFREKILAGVGKAWLTMLYPHDDYKKFEDDPNRSFATAAGPIFHKPKYHTLRLDPHDRWKAGMSTQMVYRGANYKIASHFNKGVGELEKCVSTQKIVIKWWTYHMKPLAIMDYKGGSFTVPTVTIDGVKFDGYCSQINQ